MPPNEDLALLDMDQAIDLLKTTRPTFYRWLRAGRIKGMKAGRQWRFRRDDIERFIQGDEPRIELVASIAPLIQLLTERLKELGGGAELEEVEPVAKAVQLMISLGAQLRASALHVEPQSDGRTSEILLRYRIDGILHTKATADIRLLPPIVEQWKRISKCDLNVKNQPQDGRVLQETDSEQLDLRVLFLPTVLGEAVTALFLQISGAQFSLDQLPYTAPQRATLRRWLHSPWGIIFCTGPTGSGKTTTLYSCLTDVATPERKLISIEDPVEVHLPGVMQIQVGPRTMPFSQAVRGLLRGDPDVIMIGEIRDVEMLNLSIQAALTGHLVLTTLHTDDAVGALTRMLDIGAAPFLVADATKLIVAQRLVRKLCRECSVPVDPPPGALREAIDLARRGGLNRENVPHDFRSPVGCAKCGQTGYRGRTVIAEFLEMKPDLAAAVRSGKTPSELRELAIKNGMHTMTADGILKAAEGITTLDEVLAMSPA